MELRARTAYEPGDPVGVDLERDDLSFYPLLYWPMSPAERDLSAGAVGKVDRFMRDGGTILFAEAPLEGGAYNGDPDRLGDRDVGIISFGVVVAMPPAVRIEDGKRGIRR